MNKRFAALACALGLVLSLAGCSSMLNRAYVSSSVHVEYPVGDGTSVLQAENYQGLVNAILYFVTEHKETGLIHLTNYTGDVGTALSTACREVLTEDPLGSYAVADIRRDYSLKPSYYEVNVSIEYAHTPEEVAAIVPAAGSTAIRQTISAAMAAFSPQCVLRVSYFTGDEASVEQLARQTYLDTPLAALAMPEITVSLYPNSGTSRIVEIILDWPQPVEELTEYRAALEQQALALLEAPGMPAEGLTLENLLDALRPAAVYSTDGGDTAYAALVDRSANGQGIVLALRLLCQLVDLEAMVAEGTLDGTPHFWLIVSTPEGYRHVDPVAPGTPVYSTDDGFLAAGYSWDTDRYPPCTDYAAVQPVDGLTDEPLNEDPEAPAIAAMEQEAE